MPTKGTAQPEGTPCKNVTRRDFSQSDSVTLTLTTALNFLPDEVIEGEATTTSEPGTALASPGLAASKPGGNAVVETAKGVATGL